MAPWLGEDVHAASFPCLCLRAPNLTQQGLQRNHSQPIVLLLDTQNISPSDSVFFFQAGHGLLAKNPFN